MREGEGGTMMGGEVEKERNAGVSRE